MTLRICFAISSFGQGGAQKQCVALMNVLSSRPDIIVQLIHFEGGINFDALVQDRVEILRINTKSQYDPCNIFRLVAALKRLQPDILFSWLHASDVFSAFSRLVRPKMRWMIAERDSHYPDNWRYNLRAYLGRFAAHIVPNSEKGADYWTHRGVPKNKVTVVSNINLATGSQNVSKPTSATRKIIYAGRIEPQKNVLNLAAAFVEAAKALDAPFKIIGDGTLRGELSDVVKNAAVGNIEMCAYDANIFALYGQNPIYVSLSRHEGTPNAIIENIAFGNIIVASRIPEHIGLLGPDYPYYVGVDDDPADIASVIKSAYETQGTQALSFARSQISQLTSEAVGTAYLNIFRKVAVR
tara:strand:+ start:27 stop:1088 length:1062 start_codon:yes stop_codon:yes gene_type:complete